MPDLDIDMDHLDVASTLLRSAGDAVAGACGPTGACGSATVESALAEVDGIVRVALDALADVSQQLARDVAGAAQTFTDAESALATAAGS
ncbi:hypothetical protein [Microbacterium hominis]|uniref:Uncharacterized protein n=1 Tax=Microbacterium hominis TaxID=162426 RepID=A0A0B4D5L3_9MICO|nr:hypothetical protein [Microbacterium hominis]KIC59475.1 hypothetical protein RM52_03165 [Microbacterium hominis]